MCSISINHAENWDKENLKLSRLTDLTMNRFMVAYLSFNSHKTEFDIFPGK